VNFPSGLYPAGGGLHDSCPAAHLATHNTRTPLLFAPSSPPVFHGSSFLCPDPMPRHFHPFVFLPPVVLSLFPSFHASSYLGASFICTIRRLARSVFSCSTRPSSPPPLHVTVTDFNFVDQPLMGALVVCWESSIFSEVVVPFFRSELFHLSASSPPLLSQGATGVFAILDQLRHPSTR